MLADNRSSVIFNPFKEYDSRVYFHKEPDFDTDAAWLRKKLKNTTGDVYISSGEANYQVYNQLEDELRFANDKGKVKIRFLAGPLISIPSAPGLERRQKGREFLNVIVKLAGEHRLELYPAPHRQKFHYRVFENEAITNIMEPHPLGIISSGSWFFYGSRFEAEEWKKKFVEAIAGIPPAQEGFLDRFLFLTEEENGELRDWAIKNNVDVNKVDLNECRAFWKQHTGQ